MAEQQVHHQQHTAPRPWRWVWGVVILGAVLALAFGPVMVPIIGAALLAGGLWARHEATDPRDRAIAGGVAAGGGAVVLSTVAFLVFLMPVSSTSTSVSEVVDEVRVETRP